MNEIAKNKLMESYLNNGSAHEMQADKTLRVEIGSRQYKAIIKSLELGHPVFHDNAAHDVVRVYREGDFVLFYLSPKARKDESEATTGDEQRDLSLESGSIEESLRRNQSVGEALQRALREAGY